MYLARNKRMKFQNGDKNYSYFDHRDEEELTPSKVIDYSDAFALSKFLAELDEGKYGSVTKEYENLHAQRLQVINLLSALRPSLASPCASPGLKLSQVGFSSPSSRRNQVNPDQNNVIDLDVDPSVDVSSDHHSTSKEWKDSTSVIILDSDEEDGDHQVGIKDSSSSGNAPHITPAWLESELQILRRKAMLLAREGNYNHLVPYEERNARLNHDVVEGRRLPSIEYEKVVLRAVTEKHPIQDLVNQNDGVGGGRIEGERFHLEVKTDKVSDKKKHGVARGQIKGQGLILEVKTDKKSDKQNYGVARGKVKGDGLHPELKTDKESDASPSPISFVGMQDHTSSIEIHNEEAKETPESDGLEDLWKDMSLAMEYSKGATSADGSTHVQKGEDCIHSFLLEDDLGLVCRICGVIEKSIETIFDFQWTKGARSTRTYMPGSRHPKDDGTVLYSGSKASERDLIAADIFIHPRHMKQMRPHQIEGFNFLVRNLVADKPGGCILAHAPGSGKTFMLISFIQSFLAKYPSSRPLVILPKGILATWKKEFQLWQVEDTPLYDFYSTNATSRAQQLDILRSWEENRSILFLGYKQFANIVCGGVTNKIAAACQERLLKVPGLLILDEGHTPRNESTDVLNSLAKVQTPRKVVLSGTLFQNHVREVFNILNLVRPKFLKMESSRSVVKRVLSRVHISGTRRPYKGSLDAAFYDLVEDTLQNDDNYKRKVTVIQDLRELTSNVLHYYRGDFLDELPGLSDFTVLLNLNAKQKELVQKLGTFEKFKKSAVGSAVYIHPYLKDISEHAAGDRGTAFSDEKIDSILDSINVRDGVKTKFFLNILSMCESAGEKLLVFSQYLLPLKFLERLVVQMKGWRVDKEIFMISGDSSPDHREWSMDQFNNSVDAKVFFGSIKACGEGISLVGASRVIILDVHLNPSVTRQAIGRAFRPGQKKKLYTYRLVASDSPEEEDHYTSFRKELIAKMWFEWSQYSGSREFELDEVDISNSEDQFLENPVLAEDVKALYRR